MVEKGDVILPADHNLKLYALKAMILDDYDLAGKVPKVGELIPKVEDRVKKIRKVWLSTAANRCYVRATDHNQVLDALEAQLEVNRAVGVKQDLADEIESMVRQHRRVKYGDVVMSSDHNELVEIIKKQGRFLKEAYEALT